MTDANYRHLFMVVDRSGSMQKVREATQEGINGFFTSQAVAPRHVDNRITASLFEFDTDHDTVFHHVDIADVPAYTLTPRGGTALLDAVGFAFTREGEWLAAMPEDERPGMVIAVIATDGEENSSTEWTLDRVRDLVTQQRDVYGWQILFIGANIDAVKVGGSMGINRGQTMTYNSTDSGTQSAYGTLSAVGLRTSAGFGAAFTDAERAAAVEDDK
jgi:hypothetical protein